MAGWAADLDDSLPVRVQVLIDGAVARVATADDFRVDLRGPFGFDLFVPVDGGAHQVCVATFDEATTPVDLGCRRLEAATPA